MLSTQKVQQGDHNNSDMKLPWWQLRADSSCVASLAEWSIAKITPETTMIRNRIILAAITTDHVYCDKCSISSPELAPFSFYSWVSACIMLHLMHHASIPVFGQGFVIHFGHPVNKIPDANDVFFATSSLTAIFCAPC